jgi:hypothetical protein
MLTDETMILTEWEVPPWIESLVIGLVALSIIAIIWLLNRPRR